MECKHFPIDSSIHVLFYHLLKYVCTKCASQIVNSKGIMSIQFLLCTDKFLMSIFDDVEGFCVPGLKDQFTVNLVWYGLYHNIITH